MSSVSFLRFEIAHTSFSKPKLNFFRLNIWLLVRNQHG